MEEEFKVTNDILASSGKRFANFLIDRTLFTGIFFVFGVLIAFYAELTGDYETLDYVKRFENINRFLDMLITGLLFAILYSIFEFKTQRTIGKYITKTKVVLENGEKPDLNTIITRSLCRIIPFDALSYLGNPSRGWHDTISNTYVVDIDKFENKKNTIEDFKNLGRLEDEVVF